MSKSEALAEKFKANLAQTIDLRPGSNTTFPNPSGTKDKYAGAVKSRAFAELPVGDVHRDDTQPRTVFDHDDLQRLADSIKRFGQLSPIRVRRDETRGVWVVLVGERRLRACKLAGLDRVRVEFVEREMTEADVLAEQTVENVVRADLLPVEQGRAYKRLMDMRGWTAKDLSEAIGVEATSVYRSLALLRLPEDVADKVDAGEIKATAAYEIAKLQIADDQRAVAQAVISGELDHKATVEAVRQVANSISLGGREKGRGANKGSAKSSKVSKGKPIEIAKKEWSLKAPDGRKVIVVGRKGFTEAEALATLETATQELRERLADRPGVSDSTGHGGEQEAA